ncbi:preprotein translocase subunit SecA [soil metagenome]
MGLSAAASYTSAPMRTLLTRLIGGGNDANLARLRPLVEATNALEAHYAELSEEQIRTEMEQVREEVRESAAASPPSDDELHHPERERRAELRRDRQKADTKRLQDALDDVLPDVFAAAREISKRKLGMRHFDVQLMGGAVLHQGRIAEMKTGEGKTLIAPLAAALNAMSGRGVHVVTVNDYLAKRDPQWMGPIYNGLGLSVGVIQHDSAFLFDPDYRPSDERLMHLRPVDRRTAYAADVTYGTNNELGFDYLRDNMVQELEERVQRERYFGIVDEVDNILIDEARTPLIISGQAGESEDLYYTFAKLVPRLQGRPDNATEGGDYFIDLKEHAVSPTEEGISKIERLVGAGDIYDVGSDPRLARHFEQALRAHALYKRDRDYIVKDGEIVIVDEFTGRQMPGRRWSEGLHQAIEAKEGLRVQRESVTLATITFQNYFRLYDKLSGMTGTAMTEQEEFYKIYGLEVVSIPTHRPMVREDSPDLVFRDEVSKFNALIEEVAEMQEVGRPVLVGTVSVEKSEVLSEMLKRRGVKHEVLNAKFHEKEAPIVAQAGRSGGVTIATNMAGRGTDILLGGNPQGLASAKLHARGINPAEAPEDVYAQAQAEAQEETRVDHSKVVDAGGLHIIGTERHDARRIDNQLRGRAGRQGDPGSSRFFLSLEDTLLKRFANERVTGLMERMGLEGEVAIESKLVSRTIENAQSRVEGYNFDIRKRVVEYDDGINKQRETIDAERDKVLRNEDLSETVLGFVEAELEQLVEAHLGAGVEGEAEDEDIEGLARAATTMGLTGDGLDADALADLPSREAIVEELVAAATEQLEAREQELGAETWAMVERAVLLRAIDSLWVDHLTELDDFRRGVGLRGYAGTDPLVEFKREAFKLYEELRGFIRHQVASTVFRVNVQRRPPVEATPMPTLTAAQLAALKASRVPEGGAGNGADAGAVSAAALVAGSVTSSSGASATAELIPGLRPSGARRMQLQRGDETVGVAAPAGTAPGQPPEASKLGRNDPCWCGSGKKFKRCHGT